MTSFRPTLEPHSSVRFTRNSLIRIREVLACVCLCLSACVCMCVLCVRVRARAAPFRAKFLISSREQRAHSFPFVFIIDSSSNLFVVTRVWQVGQSCTTVTRYLILFDAVILVVVVPVYSCSFRNPTCMYVYA